jgi:hypothetical protein
VPGNVVVATAEIEQGFTLGNDTNPPWTEFSGIFSSYAGSSPESGIWQERYAVRLDTPGPVTEVDTITSDHGNGQYYTPNIIGHVVIYGKHFTVRRGDSLVAFYADQDSNSGTVHLLSELRWLRDHGFLSPHAGISQIEFGWEFAFTGSNQTFQVSSFSLSTGCLPGHSASCN